MILNIFVWIEVYILAVNKLIIHYFGKVTIVVVVIIIISLQIFWSIIGFLLVFAESCHDVRPLFFVGRKKEEKRVPCVVIRIFPKILYTSFLGDNWIPFLLLVVVGIFSLLL